MEKFGLILVFVFILIAIFLEGSVSTDTSSDESKITALAKAPKRRVLEDGPASAGEHDITALETIPRKRSTNEGAISAAGTGHVRTAWFWRWSWWGHYIRTLWYRVYYYRHCYCYWRWSWWWRRRVCRCVWRPRILPTPTISCNVCTRHVYMNYAGQKMNLCYSPTANEGSTSLTSSIKVKSYPSGSITAPYRNGNNWLSTTTKTGSHYVTFEVNRSNQRKTCSAYVQVVLPQCSYPPNIANAARNNLNRNADGAVSYSCNAGYVLQGTSQFKCQHTGKGATRWDPTTWPSCQPVSCGAIPPAPPAGDVSCSDNVYKGECTFRCLNSYSLVGNNKRVCGANGVWSKSTPSCQDKIPPTIQQCTGSTHYIDKAENGMKLNPVKVEYDTPTFDDNSGSVEEVSRVSGPASGELLDLGDYTVEYEASDAAGNKKQCAFTLSVRAIRCEQIKKHVYDTDMRVESCGAENAYGSECTFSCTKNKEIFGSAVTTCEKDPDSFNAYWTHNRTLPKCHACGNIPPPKNGLVSCESDFESKFCNLQCNENFDLVLSNTYSHRCIQSTGKWSPSLPPRPVDCVELSNAGSTKTRVKWTYFAGGCSDPSTQEQIRQNTLSALQAEDICITGCIISKVLIFCGGTKRSVTTLEVEVEMEYPIDPNNYFDDITSSQQILLAERNKLHNNIMDETFPDISTPGMSMHINNESVWTDNISVLCPTGLFYIGNSFKCGGCPYGTFYNGTSDSCDSCPMGTYQDSERQSACLSCPDGMTTRESGSKNITDCKEICQAGFSSIDGLGPCSPCPRSSYNPNTRMTECIECPGNLTTEDEGSTKLSACGVADVLFGQEGKPTEPIEIQLNRTFNTHRILVAAAVKVVNPMSLLNCDIVRIMDTQLNAMFRLRIQEGNVRADIEYHDSFSTPLYHDSLSGEGMTNIGFHWEASVTGQMYFYQNGVFLDGFSAGDRSNNVISSDTVIVSLGLQCTGVVISSLHIWNTNSITFPSSICDVDAQGDFITLREITQSNAASPNVRAPAQCNDIDNCLSSPCLHGGNCTSKFLGYTCLCDVGYTGEICEVNIDECETSACENGAQCIDGIGDYTCECTSSFTGIFCQLKILNGNWGAWGEWSECSKSCASGQRSRERECSNPPPQNGGIDCIGSVDMTELCESDPCPSCSDIINPQHGLANCTKYEDGSVECTITCNDAYVMPDDANSTINCGEETSNLWPNQEPGSKKYRPPACQAYEVPKKLEVDIDLPYDGLDCSENGKASEALKNKANDNAKVTQCNGNCNQAIKVKNCDASSRRKREAGDPSPSISFKVSQEIPPPFEGKTEEELENLTEEDVEAEAESTGDSFDDAFNTLDVAGDAITNATDDGEFDVEIDGVVYTANASAMGTTVEISCPEGTLLADGVCRSCSAGTYFHEEYGCVPCAMGTYQELDRQTECEPCPDGFTTDDYGAVLEADCYVAQDVVDPHDPGIGPPTALIVGATMGVLVAVIAVFIGGVFLYRKRQKSFPAPVNNQKDPKSESSTDATENPEPRSNSDTNTGSVVDRCVITSG